MEYNYERFDRRLLQEDASFQGGPAPGEPFPDFELPTTDGGTVRKADFAGRPLLVVPLVVHMTDDGQRRSGAPGPP